MEVGIVLVCGGGDSVGVWKVGIVLVDGGWGYC